MNKHAMFAAAIAMTLSGIAYGAGEVSGWDIEGLDTGRGADYLSEAEKDVILEMNMARSNPAKYAEMYINPAQNAAARECYDEFIAKNGVPALLPSKGLSRAAKDHAEDTGPQGILSHTGTDGSSPQERMSRYGTVRSGWSENISCGMNTAREITLQLLIDDGTAGRGHRVNIMNGNSKFAGVAVGAHSRYRTICVQDFAVGYTENQTSVKSFDRVIPQSQPTEEVMAIAPINQLSGGFTAGPNPISKQYGIIKFYRQDRRINNCELRIYDVTGNVVNKVKINDNAVGTQARRKVGAWDVTDKNGRIVPDGTYLVKGVLKTSDGKAEKVSVILSVR